MEDSCHFEFVDIDSSLINSSILNISRWKNGKLILENWANLLMLFVADLRWAYDL